MRPATVDPDGPTPHQLTFPIGVTECDEQSVIDEVDDESSDTESVDSRDGMSDFEGPVPSVAPVDPVVPAITAQLESFSANFEWLDMEFLFTQRACLMKSIPGFMKGACRSAIRIALTRLTRDAPRTRSYGRLAVGNSSFSKVAFAQTASGRQDPLSSGEHITWCTGVLPSATRHP